MYFGVLRIYNISHFISKYCLFYFCRCYVGPNKTQWRKCSDRYFPYIHNIIDRLDHIPTRPYLPLPTKPWPPLQPYQPGFRPDRPPAPPVKPLQKPSLDQYEAQFDEEFLEPPKPGKQIFF